MPKTAEKATDETCTTDTRTASSTSSSVTTVTAQQKDGGGITNDDTTTQKEKSSQEEGKGAQQEKKMNKDETSRPKVCTKHICDQTYWDSTEAKKLFKSRDDDEDAKVTLERRLVLLKKALESPTAYQTLIDAKPEHLHLLKDHEIEIIKNKIMYLSILLQLAVDNMNIKKSWNQCCEETVKYMKNHYTLVGGNFGVTPLTNGSSLKRLHASFRKNDKIVLSSDGALLEKRIQKHLEKKRKLEEKHKAWVQRGWARNAKLKKLEKKIETIKEDQRKKDDDDEDDGEGDDYLSARDYELMMRY